jgi:hypothetical protein
MFREYGSLAPLGISEKSKALKDQGLTWESAESGHVAIYLGNRAQGAEINAPKGTLYPTTTG